MHGWPYQAGNWVSNSQATQFIHYLQGFHSYQTSTDIDTVFIRIVAGTIIYFEAYFPQNILSIFEKINISENLIILADK